MNKLKIAIQKSGRLNEESLKLLKNCGIRVDNGKDQLKVEVPNFPMEILYLRNSDIPQYLEDGVVDIAILGENLLFERYCLETIPAQEQITIVERLGFSKCRVSIAVPKDIESDDIRYFNGKKIATSYPNTVSSYLTKQGVQADVHLISGSVEIAPNIGLAEGICDIVSSGSTLFKNGLRETDIIMKSEAVLVKSPLLNGKKADLLETFLFRVRAVLNAKKQQYILMNVPNNKIQEVTNILPVLKSPTILPLAEEGWSSLHSVIDQDKFWEVIDELKTAGAEGILVVPIDKIVL